MSGPPRKRRSPREGGSPREGRPEQQSFEPMIDPHGDVDDVISDVPELTVEEVEKRIGATERERRRRRVAMATPARIRTAPSNRRVILWRDSATILIFVVVALLAARFLLGGNTSSIATASPTPLPTGVEITLEPTDTGLQFTQGPTLGPPVDPSSRINATPTPVPIGTLRPTPVPTPKPSKTPTPTKTPGPGSTPGPTVAPPTLPPPPVAGFTCTQAADPPFTESFTSTSSGSITSYAWTFGESGATSTLQNPTHTYSGTGDYSVTLTVTGPGGSDSQPKICSVN